MAINRKKKDALRHKYKNHCAYTGFILKGKCSVDHIIPKSKGGTDAYENLLPCLSWVNNLKSDMTLDEFRNYIIDFEKLPDAERKKVLRYFRKNFDGLFYFEKVKLGIIKNEYQFK